MSAYRFEPPPRTQVKMKVLLLTLFVAVATAIPIPDEDSGPVDVIVNGVPEGEPLEIGDIVDIKLKQHVDGQVNAATNLMHPFSAAGIAEAASAAGDSGAEAIILPEPVAPEVVPEPIILPEVVAPEVIPGPITLPEPAAPEVVPEPIVLPAPVAPEVMPDPIVLPAPVFPEVVPEPIELPAPIVPEVVEELPEAAPQFPNGEIFNNGNVQVLMNGPQEPGMFATLQGWFNMVLNYFNDGIQSTQQII